MFSDVIRETPFTSPAAEGYYGEKIYGEGFNGDNSFVSTLRALLSNRIGEHELFFRHNRWSVGSGYKDANDDQLLSAIRDRFEGDSDSFVVFQISSGDSSLRERVYNLTAERFASAGGWTKLSAITDYFRKAFDVLCFIDEAKRRTLFVTREYDMRRHHLLQAAALTAIPWYFSPSSGDRASEDEISLLRSLSESSSDGYLRALKVIADKLDFETAYYREGLRRIDTVYERERLEALKNEIESNLRSVRDYQDRINRTLTENNAKNIELIGLETKLRSGTGDSVLLSYFECNKRIRIDEIRSTSVYFHVNDYLSFFDEDIADQYLANPNSIFYSYQSDRELAGLLAKAIFIDQTVKVRTCAAYMLDVRGGFSAQGSYNFRGDEKDRIPNPHINNYECLGSYQMPINDRLRNRDFIGVLELAVASAKSIALTDGIVIDRFFRTLYDGGHGLCFETADGRQMDLEEVLKYVKEEASHEQDH